MKPQLVGLPSGWPLIHDQAAHVAVPHVSMLPLGLIDTYGGEWAAFNGRIQLILQSGTPIQQSGEAIVIAGSYSACVTEPRRFSCAIALPRSNLMLYVALSRKIPKSHVDPASHGQVFRI